MRKLSEIIIHCFKKKTLKVFVNRIQIEIKNLEDLEKYNGKIVRHHIYDQMGETRLTLYYEN